MQDSVFLLISVLEALQQRDVEGNAYQLLARLDEESELEEPDSATLRITATGVHRHDGSIAEDVTVNWNVASLQEHPYARPKPIILDAQTAAAVKAVAERARSLTSIPEIKAAIDAYEDEHGVIGASLGDQGLLGLDGQPMKAAEIMAGGHIAPVLVDITGQAVEDEVIFPAQYGSPDSDSAGWYWSATVDTHKVGLHRCDLHIMLYRPRLDGHVIEWEPEIYTVGMDLAVNQIVQTNGFTGAAIGYLPLVEPVTVEDSHG
jgi:hypothetical protein